MTKLLSLALLVPVFISCGGASSSKAAPEMPAATETESETRELTTDTVEAPAVPEIKAESNARWVPNMKSGSEYGAKVFAITAKGKEALLGLENGDTVLGFNDEEILNAGALTAAFEALESGTVTIRIERKGQLSQITAELP